jgi:hypothetical protein
MESKALFGVSMLEKSRAVLVFCATALILAVLATLPVRARDLDARSIQKIVERVALEGDAGSIPANTASSLGLRDSDIGTVGKAFIYDEDSDKFISGIEVGPVNGRREIFVVLRKYSYMIVWRIRTDGSIIAVAEGEEGNVRPSYSKQKSDLMKTLKRIGAQVP